LCGGWERREGIVNTGWRAHCLITRFPKASASANVDRRTCAINTRTESLTELPGIVRSKSKSRKSLTRKPRVKSAGEFCMGSRRVVDKQCINWSYHRIETKTNRGQSLATILHHFSLTVPQILHTPRTVADPDKIGRYLLFPLKRPSTYGSLTTASVLGHTMATTGPF
jgi:hypothetical protein